MNEYLKIFDTIIFYTLKVFFENLLRFFNFLNSNSNLDQLGTDRSGFKTLRHAAPCRSHGSFLLEIKFLKHLEHTRYLDEHKNKHTSRIGEGEGELLDFTLTDVSCTKG
jgi:hypothetical protein